MHLPPHLNTAVAYAVRPGEAVTVHGLRARAIPLVQAMSVSNDATGATVTDAGPGAQGSGQLVTVQGRIKAQLHAPQGELNGALLEDGTIVRLPPAEAQRVASDLTQGAMLYVQGNGMSGPLGRVIEATSLGSNPAQLAQIAAPSPPRPR